MIYRTLGRTGIKVSPYALGALMFATSIGNPDHEDSIRVIHKALDAGINLIDTSDSYGDSEEVVGKALKGRRDSVVLATKFSRPMGDDPNQQGTSRRWIVTAVENSLRRLQTDHIDLYQIHRLDPDTDIEETLSALSDLIHNGKVRAIGSSNTPASEIIEAQWAAERRGHERFREARAADLVQRGAELGAFRLQRGDIDIAHLADRLRNAVTVANGWPVRGVAPGAEPRIAQRIRHRLAVPTAAEPAHAMAHIEEERLTHLLAVVADIDAGGDLLAPPRRLRLPSRSRPRTTRQRSLRLSPGAG